MGCAYKLGSANAGHWPSDIIWEPGIDRHAPQSSDHAQEAAGGMRAVHLCVSVPLRRSTRAAESRDKVGVSDRLMGRVRPGSVPEHQQPPQAPPQSTITNTRNMVVVQMAPSAGQHGLSSPRRHFLLSVAQGRVAASSEQSPSTHRPLAIPRLLTVRSPFLTRSNPFAPPPAKQNLTAAERPASPPAAPPPPPLPPLHPPPLPPPPAARRPSPPPPPQLQRRAAA